MSGMSRVVGEMRRLKVAAEGYETRIEQFDGRDHLVVPVVALVEGVLHAMNASTPEFVAAEEFSRAPGGWNGRPLFEGHPLVGGSPVSGNHPEVLENRVGLIFNASYDKDEKKLKMEAWIDVERAKEKAPKLLARVEAGEDIEISVGVFVATDDTEGTFNGKKWAGAWHDIVPDHLALLVEGDTGACSRKMGCGVRAASEGESTVSKPNFLIRMLGMLRDAQPAAEMSSNDLHAKLYTALRGLEPSVSYIVGTRPADTPTEVLYTCYEYNASVYMDRMYRRGYTLASDGTVVIAAERYEVEPVMTYPDVKVAGAAPVAATEAPSADPKNAASGAPCSCHTTGAAVPHDNTHTESEPEMKKEQMAEFLKTATAEQLAELGVQKTPVVETPAATTEAPAAPAVAAQAAPVAPAVPAVAAQAPALSAADQEVLEFGRRTLAARRSASVTALKATGRCKYSDAELAAMTQNDLDRLAELAAVPAPAQPVDFSLQAASQSGTRTGANAPAPAMPSMVDRINASRK